MSSEDRMVTGLVGMVCVSIVVMVLGCITYYGKMPWYGSVFVAFIGYPSLIFMVWGDNVTKIIDTILGFFKKGEVE